MEHQQIINDRGDNRGHPSDQHDLVIFRLDRQTYALPITSIVQIIEMVTITPIPQIGNTAVEGVINVHGAAVPVVNLRRHFGLPEAALGLYTPIILAQIGEQTVGLIVDRVLDVLSLPAERVTRIVDILPEGLGQVPVLRGLAHIQHLPSPWTGRQARPTDEIREGDEGESLADEAVFLLDPEHLFLPRR